MHNSWTVKLSNPRFAQEYNVHNGGFLLGSRVERASERAGECYKRRPARASTAGAQHGANDVKRISRLLIRSSSLSFSFVLSFVLHLPSLYSRARSRLTTTTTMCVMVFFFFFFASFLLLGWSVGRSMAMADDRAPWRGITTRSETHLRGGRGAAAFSAIQLVFFFFFFLSLVPFRSVYVLRVCVFGLFPSTCQFLFNAPHPPPPPHCDFEYKLDKKVPNQLFSVAPVETIGHASSSQGQNETGRDRGKATEIFGRLQYIGKQSQTAAASPPYHRPCCGRCVCLLSVSLAWLTVRCRYSTFKSICHPDSSNWIG